MTFQIPLPSGLDITELELYYRFESDDDTMLVPVEHVYGWLVPDNMHVVSDAYGDWIELTVRHCGIVQIKQRAATNTPAGLSTHIPQGDLLLLLTMVGIIGLLAIHKRRAI